MRTSSTLLAALLVGACAATPPSTAEHPGACSPCVDPEVPRYIPGPASLLLATTDAAQPTTELMFVAIDSDVPALGQRLTAPAKALAGYASPTFAPMVAHDGFGATLTLTDTTGRTLAYRDAQMGMRTFALEAAPDALELDENEVFLGIGTTVQYARLDVAEPTLETVVTLTRMGQKAFDVFARHGDFLIAIDDILVPIYAASFHRRGGASTHMATYELPPFVNGMYVFARFVGTETGTGTLYAVGRYSVLDGHGQTIAAIAFTDGRPDLGRGDIMNATASPRGQLFEEHVSRADGRPVTLLTGAEFTYFNGMDVLEDATTTRLLFAAGDRGLLVMQARPRAAATANAALGITSCDDVLVRDGKVFVLAASSLIVLDASLVETHRIALPLRYARFVR